MLFSPTNKTKGFTLIELLVTIAIIGVLASLVVGVSRKAIDSADSVRCLSNLKDIAVAITLYGNDNEGLLPGPCDNGIRNTYRINNGDLGALLAPYWGLPAADGVTRYAPSLLCPAWKHKMKMTDGKCYWCPARLKGYYTPTNPPSNNICPFGKGQPDGQPMRMQAVNQIAGFKASQQWMVQDYDQINAPSANAPWEALTPVHGSVRNVLFFDLHAESLPASTVLN